MLYNNNVGSKTLLERIELARNLQSTLDIAEMKVIESFRKEVPTIMKVIKKIIPELVPDDLELNVMNFHDPVIVVRSIGGKRPIGRIIEGIELPSQVDFEFCIKKSYGLRFEYSIDFHYT